MSASDEEFITRRIYAIKCNLNNTIYYVGSTKNSLNRRFNRHKTAFKLYMNGNKRTSISIFDKFKEKGVDNFSIDLLKEYKSIDKKGILAMETLWICKLSKDKNKYCIINKQMSFRSGKYHLIEYNKEIQKKYREENKEIIKKSNKNYNESHKEDKSVKHKQYRENNKDKYKCDICEYYTYCQSDLNRHNENISHKLKTGELTEDDIIKSYKFKCNYCEFYNNERDDFIKHLKCEEHSNTIKNLENLGEKIIIDFEYHYNCEICNFYSDHKNSYEIHLISKSHIENIGEKYKPKFVCDMCNYSNNLKKNYDKHCKTKNHIEKLYMFNISNGLEKLQINTLIYKYTCEDCNFRSDDKSEYNNHVKSRSHCEKIGIEFKAEFECKPCKFEIHTLSGYNRHLKSKSHSMNTK